MRTKPSKFEGVARMVVHEDAESEVLRNANLVPKLGEEEANGLLY